MSETVSETGLVSVVIPVFDSPDLGGLAARIQEVLGALGRPFEIIFVDDGSPDPRIWPELVRLARERECVRAIQLTRNFGQQAATLCGMQEARGDVVITMDDDFQHDPRDIPMLLAQAHRDIVIGQLIQNRHHLLRRLFSRAKGVFDQVVIGKPRGLRLSSFRMLSRTVVDGVLSMRTPHPFIPALMFHVSKDIAAVPVSHSRRAAGRSGYTLRKLLRLFSNLVINNSSILLRCAAYAGVLLALVSFSLAALVVYRKLVHDITVQGWTSLFAAIMMVGGLLLMTMGVIGEYLIRIIESSEARPTYIVRKRSA
jgi:dolichol-phosphate mannosyltransferase/undecaprenyl-phosphate 4-deoxy-4-formamido-L-arabinose transferase